MTSDERERLQSAVNQEGFDYCFVHYSDWEEIKDDKFHKLREQYLEASKNLERYVFRGSKK